MLQIVIYYRSRTEGVGRSNRLSSTRNIKGFRIFREPFLFYLFCLLNYFSKAVRNLFLLLYAAVILIKLHNGMLSADECYSRPAQRIFAWIGLCVHH